VLRLRKRQVKNFCALLLLANGTPMFRTGDEFLQTQGGNSNPYNQDNETTWLDWTRLQAHADVHRFFRRMIAFRKAHPSLSRSRFWRDDVRWYGVGHAVELSDHSHSLAFCLRGASQGDCDLYVMINASGQDQTFTLQEGQTGQWRRVIDTGRDNPDDFREPGQEVPLNSGAYVVASRSVVVLVR
jgi:glycogen operon protein